MQNFTNLVNDRVGLIQGPAAILNVLPWIASILPTFILRKILRVNKLEHIRDELGKFLKVMFDSHILFGLVQTY